MAPLSLKRVKGSMLGPLFPERPMSESQSLRPLPSPRAAQVLLALARTAPNQTWTLLDSPRLADELGLRISDLVQLLRELEALALVERWPLGSLVYLTEQGRALAAELKHGH
jgi:DNA-binding MarR family transcriptional regulator